MNYSYHNTTDSTGDKLDEYEEKAKSQEERLLRFFKLAYERGADCYILITPSAALDRVFHGEVPITSVRRALSNLTRDGHLMKDGQVRGAYGRPEYYWRLVPQTAQREMF